MTNFDYYKNEIKELLNKNPDSCIAITLDNELISCDTENFTCSIGEDE